jgi:hypothetical protein
MDVLLRSVLYNGGIELSHAAPEVAPDHTIERFCERALFSTFVKSTVIHDAGWDTPLTPSASLSADLSANSQRRLNKACEVIKRFFASHSEEGAEACELAKQAFLDERAAMRIQLSRA